MAELPLFDASGKKIGTLSIDEAIFGKKVKKVLLKDVLVWYGRNKRSGSASTKTRGEVAGSTKKPWKQKHTGRARSGTIRSPIWRHGGIVFGPRPRDYSVKIPQKMRKAALDSAILGKIQDKEVFVIEGFQFEKPSTKKMIAILKNMGIDRTCLVGVKEHTQNALLSMRNLQNISMTRSADLNAYAILRHKDLLLTKDAVEQLVGSRGGKLETVGVVAGT